ncbi:MAG: HD domain-containing protein [Crocinitomicaceae bacterium]|jgi:class 3 adenylate cyclase/predicted metal-dependent HD superfamily phosphohydrolase|nr:HD domain-containing protein [Crocinitomicaceae bacterium]
MERFVHFLIVEPDTSKHSHLRKILSLSGAILLFVENLEEAKWELTRKEIGIVLLNPELRESRKQIKKLKESDKGNRAFFLAMLADENLADIHQILREGFTDYLFFSFDTNTIKAKLKVYKSLFQKDQRIGHLLTNIFPEQVLEDLNSYGKYSPRRVDKGVVVFTDFVDFSKLSKDLQPIEIVRRLEQYFSKFDEIINRYQLEKIKTIGDAYMAIAGVTESYDQPILRASLAALEIREWIKNENLILRSQKKSPWEIRIGIHAGPLVAGILGSNKMSFDVWGDTVNLAARSEEVSWPGQITITEEVAKNIKKYFDLEHRGALEIKKRGGEENMYFLLNLKDQYCLYQEGLSPSAELREMCGLPRMDFNSMRNDILSQLEGQLSSDLHYHNVEHTIGVEKAAIRLAKLEGLSQDEINILLTAVLYHDSGFLFQYEHNEPLGIKLAKTNLPKYGYSEEQIKMVCQIIDSTSRVDKVSTLLEKIMTDADHDYFGRAEYHLIANRLRSELQHHGQEFSDEEWLIFQLDYLEKTHVYFTPSAISIRLPAKKKRINELKRKLQNLRENK